MAEPLLISVKRAAALCEVQPAIIYAAIKSKQLKAKRIGKGRNLRLPYGRFVLWALKTTHPKGK